jgi:hypothetical protein
MNQKELVEAFVRGVTRDATNYEPDRDSDFEAEFTARRVCQRDAAGCLGR